MSVIPELRRFRQEDQKFKIILRCTENSRPALDTGKPVSKKNKKTVLGVVFYTYNHSTEIKGQDKKTSTSLRLAWVTTSEL